MHCSNLILISFVKKLSQKIGKMGTLLAMETVQSNRFYSVLSDNLYLVKECT